MTSTIPHSLESATPDSGNREQGEVKVRVGGNILYKFNERTDAAAVQVARQVHAIGYADMHFVNDEALMPDGTLRPDIDKARGDNVDYYLLINPEDEVKKATLRKISGDVWDLPAFGLTTHNLTKDGLQELLEAENVKEIAALARTPEAKQMLVFELLRDAFQEAIGNNETWFFSIVSSTFASLEGQFGPLAIRSIGEPIAFDDERISEDISLVPAILDVDNFLNAVAGAAAAETDSAKQMQYVRTLMYFADGVDDKFMNDDTRALHDMIKMQMLQKGA